MKQFKIVPEISGNTQSHRQSFSPGLNHRLKVDQGHWQWHNSLCHIWLYYWSVVIISYLRYSTPN